MLTPTDAPRPTRSVLCEVEAAADLTRIHDRTVQIVQWNRRADPVATRFVEEQLVQHRIEQVATLDPQDLAEWSPIPSAARERDRVGAAALDAELRQLVTIFGHLTGAIRIGARFLRLSRPMCPRFHTDFVGVRLLTTWCGPGTEWLEPAEIDRGFLGHRAEGKPDEESGLLREGAQIRCVPATAVALLKGEAWPGNAGHGAVHRSPRGASRILFSLDVLAQDPDQLQAIEGKRHWSPRLEASC